MELSQASIVIPYTGEARLLRNFLRCSERHRHKDVEIQYVIVNNTEKDAFVQDVLDIVPSPTVVSGDLELSGSAQNGRAVEIGAEHATHEWLLIVHCDTAITSPQFWAGMRRMVDTGCVLIGTCLDPIRVNAVRQSCILTRKEYVESSSMFPTYHDKTKAMIYDCCDALTLYCREHDLPFCVFNNTVSGYPDAELPTEYHGIPADRAVSGGEVVFLHLGRGALKTQGAYSKSGKWSVQAFVDFCETEVLG